LKGQNRKLFSLQTDASVFIKPFSMLDRGTVIITYRRYSLMPYISLV